MSRILTILSLLVTSALLAAEQTLEWSRPAVGELLPLNQAVPLAAVASSGLPVSFRVIQGPAEIDGGMIMTHDVGTVVLVAEQAGNAQFAPVSLTRRLNPSSVAITPVALPNGINPAPSRKVTIQGTMAFLPAGARGVLLIELADPAGPKLVATIDTEGSAKDVAVEGRVLLVADSQSVVAYDITIPEQPVFISNYPMGAAPWDRVAFTGNVACLANSTGGAVEFVDYTNPSVPKSLAKKTLPASFVQDVSAADGLFAVANGAGLALFNPEPVPVNLPGAWAVDLAHGQLAVGGNRTVSLLNPTAEGGVKQLGQYDYPEPGLIEVRHVAVAPRWVVATEGYYARLSVLSFADPAHPEVLGERQLNSTLLVDVALTEDGSMALVSFDDGDTSLFRLREGIAQTLSFDLPRQLPAATTQVELNPTASTGRPVTLSVVSGPATLDGNRLVITAPGDIVVQATQAGDAQYLPVSEQRTLTIVDRPVITVQPDPVAGPAGQHVTLKVETAPSVGLTYQWYRDNQAISTANGPQFSFNLTTNQVSLSLYAVVITNQAGSITSRWVSAVGNLPGAGVAVQPRGVTGNLQIGAGSGAPIRIQRRGPHAWVVNGWENALRLFDLSDRDHPVQIAQANGLEDSRTFDLALVDDTALIVERATGLGIYDLSNPLQPVRVGGLHLPGGLANSITVRDRRAYVGAESAGLIVLDVDNPRAPVILGSNSGSARANGVFVEGSFAATAEWNQGVSFFDVSNPASPVFTGNYGVLANGRGFAVAGRDPVVYLGDTDLGLRTFVRRGTNTPLLGRALAGGIWDLKLVGRYLLAAGRGLRVIDVSNPTNAVALGSTGPTSCIGLHVFGNEAAYAERNLRLADLTFSAMPPVLTHTPEIRRVRTGASVTLTAPVAGTGPFTYQWTHGDQLLEGATQADLPVTSFTQAATGDYTVTVTGPYGTVSGRIATLWAALPVQLPVTATLRAEGGVRFLIQTATDAPVVVLVSDDLGTWTEGGTLNRTGPETEYVVTPANGAEHKFYRFEAR